jgi:hypothetical protein
MGYGFQVRTHRSFYLATAFSVLHFSIDAESPRLALIVKGSEVKDDAEDK